MGNTSSSQSIAPSSPDEGDFFSNHPPDAISQQSAFPDQITSSTRSLTTTQQHTSSATTSANNLNNANNDSSPQTANEERRQSILAPQDQNVSASLANDGNEIHRQPPPPRRGDLYASTSLRSINVQDQADQEDNANATEGNANTASTAQQAEERRRAYQQFQQTQLLQQIQWRNTVDELSTLIYSKSYVRVMLYLARGRSLIPPGSYLYRRENTTESLLQRALLDGAPEEVVSALIKRGKKQLVTLKDDEGHTATHYMFLIRPSMSLMNELVQICGKDIFLETNLEGYTPLHSFLRYNASYETIKFVLDECLVINGTNLLRMKAQLNNYLPLHAALINDAISYDIIKLLLDRDKNDDFINFNNTEECWPVNQQTLDGWLPIHIALSYKLSLPIIELLIEKGGTNQLLHRAAGGWSALGIALVYNLTFQIIKLLVEKGGTDQLQDLATTGHLPLHSAVENNVSLEVIKYLVEQGGVETVRTPSFNGALPIHIAASNKKVTLDLIEYLVEVGGQQTLIEKGTDFDLNALGFSLSNGLSADIIRCLITHGGAESIQQKRDVDGLLPVHVALQNVASMDIIRPLCESYNVNNDDNVIDDYYEGYTTGGRGTLRQSTSNGWCAIHYAVYYGCDPEVVRFIHEFGGKDIFFETDFDNVSATYSAWYGSILSNDDADTSEEQRKIDQVDRLLNFVINKQGDEIMKYLSKESIPEAAITCQDKEFQRSILQRALNGNAPYFIVEKMIEVGGQRLVTIKDSELNNALHYINDANSIDTVKLLVDTCGKQALYEKNKSGYFPVHSLIRTFASTLALRLFVEESEKETLTERDNLGWIPLHHATSNGSAIETVKFLLEVGGEETLLLGTNEEYLPINLAVCNRAPRSIVKYLIEKDVNKESLRKPNVQGVLPIHAAFLASPPVGIDVISLLIEEGGIESTRQKDDFGFLPIHYACRERAGLEPVKLLVEKNGKGMLKQKTNEGWLPIHFAVMTDLLDVIKYLVEKGGKYTLQTRTNDGSLPIHVAMQYCKSFEVIKFILDTGGMETLRIEDNGGWLATHIAFNYGQALEVYEYIIKNGDNATFTHQNEFYATPLELLYNGRKETRSITYIHNLILEKGLQPSDCSDKTIMASLKWVNSLDSKSENEVVKNDTFVKVALNDKFTKGRATVFFVLLDIALQATAVWIYSFVVDLFDSEKNYNLALPVTIPCLVFFGLREIIEMHSTPVRVYSSQATNLVDLIQIALLAWLTDYFVRRNYSPRPIDQGILLFTTGFLWLNLLFKLANVWYPLSMLVAALTSIAQQLIPFIFTSIIVIIAFAHLFRIQYADGEECYSDTQWTESDGWLDEWKSCAISISYIKASTMFLDAGNWADHWKFHDGSIWLMIVFAAIVGLLLLNIVIAVINNIFTEVQASAEKAFWINRINTVCDTDSMLNLYRGIYQILRKKQPKEKENHKRGFLIPSAIPKDRMEGKRFSFSNPPPDDQVLKSLPAGINKWWFGIEESPPSLFARMKTFYMYADLREIIFPDVEFESMLLGRSEIGAASSILLFDYVRDMRSLNSKSWKVELSLFGARNVSWIVFILQMSIILVLFLVGLVTFGLLWPPFMKNYLFQSGLSSEDLWGDNSTSSRLVENNRNDKEKNDENQGEMDNQSLLNEIDSLKIELEALKKETSESMEGLTNLVKNLLSDIHKAQSSISAEEAVEEF